MDTRFFTDVDPKSRLGVDCDRTMPPLLGVAIPLLLLLGAAAAVRFSLVREVGMRSANFCVDVAEARLDVVLDRVMPRDGPALDAPAGLLSRSLTSSYVRLRAAGRSWLRRALALLAGVLKGASLAEGVAREGRGALGAMDVGFDIDFLIDEGATMVLGRVG